MDEVKRLTERKVSTNSNGSPHIGIGGADLSLLNIKPNDKVKVVVSDNEIRIKPK